MDKIAQRILAFGGMAIIFLIVLSVFVPDFTSVKLSPTEVLVHRPDTSFLPSDDSLELILNYRQDYATLKERIDNLESKGYVFEFDKIELRKLSDKVVDAINNGDFDTAHAITNEILEKENYGPFGYWTLAFVLDMQGNFDDAIIAYDKSLELIPNNVTVLMDKSYSLYLSGEYEKSIKVLDEILELDPNNEAAIIDKLFLLDLLGRSSEKINLFDQLLELDPENVGALNDKGVTLLDLGKPEEAIIYFKKSMDLNKTDWAYPYNAGKAYFAMGEYNNAVDFYEISFLLEPTDSALIEQSSAYGKLDRYDEAILNLDIVLYRFPDHPVALLNKGISLHLIGELEEAIIWYDKRLEVIPNDFKTLELKNIVLQELLAQK